MTDLLVIEAVMITLSLGQVREVNETAGLYILNAINAGESMGFIERAYRTALRSQRIHLP